MIIGIDPDTERSGVAVYDRHLELGNKTLPEMFELLYIHKHSIKHVYISAGWLNRPNFHHKASMKGAVIARIGERTGANHEIGKQIAKMCEHLGIAYTLIRPTKSKPTHEYLCKLSKDFANYKKSNQEQRDAFYCILGRF